VDAPGGAAEDGAGGAVTDGGDPGREDCAKATAPRVASVAIAPAERKGGGRMVPTHDGILCGALRQMNRGPPASSARFIAR
jgi:hypothetical protein